jgi:hypothetical protein
MMISEYSFSWLHEAEEERLRQELEHRRVVAERLAEQAQLLGRPAPEPRARRRRRSATGRVSPAGGTM